MRVLVTGGAGFIGSRLAIKLINNNVDVILMDNLNAQIHGEIPVLADFILLEK